MLSMFLLPSYIFMSIRAAEAAVRLSVCKNTTDMSDLQRPATAD